MNTCVVPPEEIRAAEDKFESSKTVCYNAMLTLTEGEASLYWNRMWYARICSSEVVVADYIRVFMIHDAAGTTA